jgi:CO/xanthine dehydrogenase FAD-binding subunit
VTAQYYFQPTSSGEAVDLLDKHGPGVLLLAGGTIAMPLVNEGISMPEKVLSLRKAGLNTIQRNNGNVAIGATTTLTQMVTQSDVPILQEAAHAIGGWAIRNMGTVGGNLFAPPPAGDFAVALLALDARVTLISKHGKRTVALEDFYIGFLITDLREGEIVEQIQLPLPKGKTAYTKFGRRHANTPAVVTVAANILFEGDTVKEARLALNAVGPYPLRAKSAEAALVGSKLDPNAIAAASTMAIEEAQPFTDAVASEWYRRKMVGVIVRRTLEKIAGGG